MTLTYFFLLNQCVDEETFIVIAGAQKGALYMMLEINSLYFIVLIWYLSPAFAPGAYKWTSTEVFFMPEIQKLSTFLG